MKRSVRCLHSRKMGREGERDVRLEQDHAIHAAMVEAMDLAAGKVLAKLDALGLSGNTLVIFTSDKAGFRPARAGRHRIFRCAEARVGFTRVAFASRCSCAGPES